MTRRAWTRHPPSPLVICPGQCSIGSLDVRRHRGRTVVRLKVRRRAKDDQARHGMAVCRGGRPGSVPTGVDG
jgi:hypothetical protein